MPSAASVYEGAALPATGPFAPSEPWAGEKQEKQQQNLEEARKLLASAGYTAGRPLEIIAIVERAEFADVAAVVQENLKSHRHPRHHPVQGIRRRGAGRPGRELRHAAQPAEPADRHRRPHRVPHRRLHLHRHLQPEPLLRRGVRPDHRRGGDDRGHRPSVTSCTPRRARILQDKAVNVWLVNEQATDAIRTNVLSYVQDPLSRYVLTAKTAKSGS